MNINAETVYLGIYGYPLKHTHSPYLHNATLRKLGINAVYLSLEIPPSGLGEAVQAMRALNFRGVNVTIPHKENIIKYLDRLSPAAEVCGAVNVISNENGSLVGYNTDGPGFIASLREASIAVAGRALIIGAGGAARSIAYELAGAGVTQIDFLDVDEKRAASLAGFITGATSCRTGAWPVNAGNYEDIASCADLIINCSPVGMFPHVDSSPLQDMTMLKPQAVLYDLIYNPLTTRFLAMGAARGHKIFNGLPMFVHQAALSLQIWLGINPPLRCMKEVMSHKEL